MWDANASFIGSIELLCNKESLFLISSFFLFTILVQIRLNLKPCRFRYLQISQCGNARGQKMREEGLGKSRKVDRTHKTDLLFN
jgi:hypothetical protein